MNFISHTHLGLGFLGTGLGLSHLHSWDVQAFFILTNVNSNPPTCDQSPASPALQLQYADKICPVDLTKRTYKLYIAAVFPVFPT